ncbi:four helix bundle protein [Ereboglobus luteus]|nr:four helix bundle protein [Ereboglobus luteus]
MNKNDKDLPERTYQYGRRIIALFEALPEGKVAQVLGMQVLRSGTSVGANYSEADFGRTKPEFIAKMGDCLRELAESNFWLRNIQDSKLVKSARIQPLRDETEELIRIFITIIKKTKNDKNNGDETE